jgi:flagellar biosynthetic protein FliQ
MNDVVALTVDALATVALVAGPLLLASLVTGVVVGVAQTVTQINEQSISFLAKAACVAAVVVALGGGLAQHLTGFARRCFGAVELVVR